MKTSSYSHGLFLSRFLLQYKLKGPDNMLNPAFGYINLYPKISKYFCWILGISSLNLATVSFIFDR